MTTKMREYAKTIALVLGTSAALTNWMWAKGFIALWILLWAFTFLKPRDLTNSIQNQLAFFALAVSVSGAGLAYCSPLHPLFVAFFWIAVIAYTAVFLRCEESKEFSCSVYWPTRFLAFLFAIIFGAGTLLAFRILSAVLDRPFDSSWWTPLTWSAAGFLFAYPQSVETYASQSDRTIVKWLAPISIATLVCFHAIQYVDLDTDLNAADSNHRSHAPIAKQAFDAGYTKLGIKGALWHTSHLFHREGCKQAVAYHRSMWRYVEKERLAHSFLQDSVLDDNLFLFTTCYGSSLALNPSEQSVDFDAVINDRTYWVLTTQRLIRIGEKGIETTQTLNEVPVALSISKGSGKFAILNASGSIQIIQKNVANKTISLPNERVWKDIIINDSGTTVWTLDGNGRIEKYAISEDGQQWAPQGEIHPPLWGDPTVAQAFYSVEHPDAFYVLDAALGVHYRDNPPQENNADLQKRLLEYYNQNRRVAGNLGFWKPLSSIAVLEKTGRILFIPIVEQTKSNQPENSSANETQAFPRPIESLLHYDPAQADWFRKMESVAVIALPEVNTILTLQRNGTIQAIAMPQGYFIRFVHSKWFRLATVEE